MCDALSLFPPLFTVDKLGQSYVTDELCNSVQRRVERYLDELYMYNNLRYIRDVGNLSNRDAKVLNRLSKTFSNPMSRDAGCVYLARLRSNRESLLKIGITSNIATRFNGIPYGVNCLLVTRDLSYTDVRIIEHIVLDIMQQFRVTPAVYFSGRTECMKDTATLDLYIKSIINEVYAQVTIQGLDRIWSEVKNMLCDRPHTGYPHSSVTCV